MKKFYGPFRPRCGFAEGNLGPARPRYGSLSVCVCLASMAIFFSCAAGPGVLETPPGDPAHSPPETLLPEASPETDGVPVRPEKPPVPVHIMGNGRIPSEDMTSFLLGINPSAEKAFVENLVLFYTEEAAIEGVNHDTAFAQMCLETGYLRYGNLVTPDMNNFCGLGAIGPGQEGERFPNPRIGVRAHIQHLKAYATEAPLKQELVDPRYHYVRRGSSPVIKGLSGTWAVDLSYADKINAILERLYSFSYEFN